VDKFIKMFLFGNIAIPSLLLLCNIGSNLNKFTASRYSGLPLVLTIIISLTIIVKQRGGAYRWRCRLQQADFYFIFDEGSGMISFQPIIYIMFSE
jgi:hypothetical protein